MHLRLTYILGYRERERIRERERDIYTQRTRPIAVLDVIPGVWSAKIFLYAFCGFVDS